jgi:hypothetical protein
VLDRDFQKLDAAEIGRDRTRWRQVSRVEALRGWRDKPVAVVHRGLSRDNASWFKPANRFFRADGPFLYDGLRYFQYVGAGSFGDSSLKKSLGQLSKPPEAELEPMDAFDMNTGEFLALGSPAAKVPKKPLAPKPPSLPEVPKPPSIPELDLPEIPEIPEIPTLPEIPGIPDLPTLPEFAIPKVPEIPAVPGVPQIPGLPDIPDLPDVPVIDIELSNAPLIPIEYRLLDGKGNPLPPTAFKVTLPDGTFKTGKSDAEGFIRIPDNKQKGQAKLELLDPDEKNPERIAAFLSPVAKGKHPIEIKLADSNDKAMPEMAFRLKLPDGSVKEGKSDKDGFIRFPDNEQQGEMELVLTAFTERET